ncbi:MAG: sarcosine oxidase subunit delta [Gammaproteobacteria bacterium]|jgi:sarcosine oxidase subunit delta
MLMIECPWCGRRDESEFTCGGEAHIVRPADPFSFDDAQWADYLFMRTNPKGLHREQWNHSAGCRRWFNVQRDTVSYRISHVYKVGDLPPGEPA